MYIFLDDERNPADVTWVNLPDVEWLIVRTPNAFKTIIKEQGIPHHISFDNDLGTCEEGRHLAKWMIEEILDNNLTLPSNFSFTVHSKNPIASRWIEQYLQAAICHMR